jgi:hypothetical protein
MNNMWISSALIVIVAVICGCDCNRNCTVPRLVCRDNERLHNHYRALEQTNWNACKNACLTDSDCYALTYSNTYCFLLDSRPDLKYRTNETEFKSCDVLVADARQRCDAPLVVTNDTVRRLVCNVNMRMHNHYRQLEQTNWNACKNACLADSDCYALTYTNMNCFLFDSRPGRRTYDTAFKSCDSSTRDALLRRKRVYGKSAERSDK